MKRDGGSRKAAVRCLNCFARFEPGTRATQATCPKCAAEWRISWVEPGMAKIRGPVWDKHLGANP